MSIRIALGVGVSVLALLACAEDGRGNKDDTSSGTANGGSAGNAGGGDTGGMTTTGGSGGTSNGGAGGGVGGMMGSNGECLEVNGVLQFQCNPVTNEPCEDEDACDISGMSEFACADMNTAGLGEACDQEAGPYCTAGLTCFMPDPNDPDGVGSLTACAAYCCTDMDCGAGTTCTKTANGGAWFPQTPLLGVCQ